MKLPLNSPLTQNLAKWIFLLAFFLFAPEAVLHLVRISLDTFVYPDTPGPSSHPIAVFYGDFQMILLSFYCGAFGAVAYYAYQRTNRGTESDTITGKGARFLFTLKAENSA